MLGPGFDPSTEKQARSILALGELTFWWFSDELVFFEKHAGCLIATGTSSDLV